MQQTQMFTRHGAPAPVFSEPQANFTETSRAAARSIEPKAGTKRAQVLDSLRWTAQHPQCTEAIAERTGIKHDTVKPRVAELHEAGLIALIEKPGEWNGNAVKVYVPVEHVNGRKTLPFVRGKRATEANRKLERLRQQIRDMGGVPCC